MPFLCTVVKQIYCGRGWEESFKCDSWEKKPLRLTKRLHFGELNQLNGCGRVEQEAGCVHRAEELSGKRLGFSCQGWIFYLSFHFIGEALTRRSLFLIFQSRFSSLKCFALSQFSTFSSLFFFFYFGPITFSCSDPILNYFPFSKLLNSRQTERHYRLRWEKTGRWFKVYFIAPQGILRRKEVIIRPCLKDLTYRMKPSLCNLSVLNHTGSRVHYNTSLQSGWAPWKQVEPWEWDLKQKKTLKPRQLRLVVLF